MGSKTDKMYIGVDMGTSSVGWAVTDEKYKLLRTKGKDMWGVRLFDEANTSVERRSHRSARRRRQRETTRLALLKSLFYEEIEKIDPGFMVRLEESKLHLEDRSNDNNQKYALFNDKDYTDKDYYRDYPTIFHLRKELIESEQKNDIRLIYLAIHSMFKRRGNFVNTSLSENDEVGDMTEAIDNFLCKVDEYNDNAGVDSQIDIIDNIEAKRVEEILGDKTSSRSRILENMVEYLQIKKTNKKMYELLLLMCGMTAKIVNIFGDEVVGEESKKLSLCFRDSSFEESEINVIQVIGDDNYELIRAVKNIHDIGLLANIMKGHKYISMARVESYEEHKRDLELLKRVLKKYDAHAYNEMFRIMKNGNYSAYVGSVNSIENDNRQGTNSVRRHQGENYNRTQEELCKNILAILKKFPQSDDDVIVLQNKALEKRLLPKQLTSSNGIIPNQVFVIELKKILKNAEKHYDFLSETDESGLTVSKRILQLFSFRIPYYIGPLGTEYVDKKGYNVWAVHKEGGKIYPWNLEDKIDTKATAEKFIGRMVRKCTYLHNETTLPKNSLLYEKFMVLNELNNVCVYGEKISVELKQQIFKELFCAGKRVSMKKLESWFIEKNVVEKGTSGFISGIDETGFKASLSSLGKFIGVFGASAMNDDKKEMIENIIFWGTVYGDDRKLVRERIVEKYGDVLSDIQIKRILGFKFSGWGNLSREFLEMEGESKEDGTISSIIITLWEKNENLMMLLSDRYTYMEKLQNRTQKAEKSLAEWQYDDMEDMYLSNPVKRMVWQTMKVLREIEEITGKVPDKVFVEMPREDGIKGERKISRKKKLLDLYTALRDEGKQWKEEINDLPETDFRIKKLYLYYLQMGKCMYTGKSIDLERLLKDNDSYDIEHIYPRHFVKDDSIENNLILVDKNANAKKSDVFPIDSDIQALMLPFWKILLSKGFISKEKYDRLVRKTEFSDDELASFIARQLVETRQGTKVITQILQQAYPNATIVFTKAGVVSDFRHKFGIEKVRCVNPFHHAKDAYLNIVVGNVYYTKFTSNPINFIKDAKNNKSDFKYKYHMDKIFDYDVENGEVAWRIPKEGVKGTIGMVKDIMSKNTPLITKRSYVRHGGISDKDTIYGRYKAKETGYLSMKTSDERLADVTKYGGRTSINTMCYCLVKYSVNGKEIRSLEALPMYLGNINTLPDNVIEDFLLDALTKEHSNKEVNDLLVLIKCIRFNSLMKINGFYYYIAGKTDKNICFENAVPLCMGMEDELYVRKIEKAYTSEMYDQKDKNGKYIISSKRNIEIYEKIKGKLINGIYSKKKCSIVDILVEGTEMFANLELKKQCYILLKIIEWCQLQCITVDTRYIGGKEKVGLCRINKKISSLYEAKIIYQSNTGLYESEVDMLKL